MKKLILMATMAAAALALLAMPGVALAKRGDRNHDRIPDRWEKHFHLSLKVNQANKDQDRDGLDNMGELRSHTNPRKADTDGDGVRDGAEDRDHDGLDNEQEQETGNNPNDADTDNNGVEDGEENAGTIASFDQGTNTLTIDLGNNRTVSGLVTDGTRIECRSANETENENEVHSADHGGGSDNSGPGSGDDNETAPACGRSDLTQGTAVHEAELQNENGQAVFEKIEIVM